MRKDGPITWFSAHESQRPILDGVGRRPLAPETLQEFLDASFPLVEWRARVVDLLICLRRVLPFRILFHALLLNELEAASLRCPRKALRHSQQLEPTGSTALGSHPSPPTSTGRHWTLLRSDFGG